MDKYIDVGLSVCVRKDDRINIEKNKNKNKNIKMVKGNLHEGRKQKNRSMLKGEELTCCFPGERFL